MIFKKSCCLITGIIVISGLFLDYTNILSNNDDYPVMQEFNEKDLQLDEQNKENNIENILY